MMAEIMPMTGPDIMREWDQKTMEDWKISHEEKTIEINWDSICQCRTLSDTYKIDICRSPTFWHDKAINAGPSSNAIMSRLLGEFEKSHQAQTEKSSKKTLVQATTTWKNLSLTFNNITTLFPCDKHWHWDNSSHHFTMIAIIKAAITAKKTFAPERSRNVKFKF